MTELFLTHGSYLGIIAILILTGTGLPIPEEVPVIAAGILSSNGQLEPQLAFFACLIGAIVGDCVMYWIGRHFGRNIIREHPWWAHFVKPEREAQLERTLQEHDWKVFFFARFLVGVRSPVYLAAGVLQLPFRRFIMIDMVCATAVIGTFFGLSYYFGDTIVRWIRGAELGLTGILIIVVAIIAGIYLYRRRKKKLESVVKEILETTDDEEENFVPTSELDATSNEEDHAQDVAIATTSVSKTTVVTSDTDSALNDEAVNR